MSLEDAVEAVTTETTEVEPGGGTGVVEPSPEPEAATEAAPEADAPKAEDKPADPPKRSLQDVVQDALKTDSAKKDDEAPVNPDAKPKPEEVKAEDAEGKTEGKVEEDPDADIAAFKDHPRWQQMTKERDEYKAEVETLKGPAEEFGKIQNFMSQHNVPAEEVAEAMTIVAMMKNPDTVKDAVTRLQALADQGRAFLGEGIDADLQQRVDDGEISEAFAKEMTKQRATANATRQAAEAAQRRAEQATQTVTETQRASAMDQVRNRATNFLAAKQSTDPDFALKAPFLQNAIAARRAAHQGEMTPEVGEKIVAEAYDEVTKNLLAVKPKPQPTPKAPSSTSPGSGSAPANPKSLQEAVALGLNSGVAA